MAEITQVSGVLDLPIKTPHHLPATRITHHPEGQTVVQWEKPLFVDRRTHADRRYDEHKGDKLLFDTRQRRGRRKNAVVDYSA